MSEPSNPPIARVPFEEIMDPNQEMHILVRVRPHFTMRSFWDELHEDPLDNVIGYSACFECEDYPLDCKLELHISSNDAAELLQSSQAIVAGGAVEVWGWLTLDVTESGMHPRIDVDEFRPRTLDEDATIRRVQNVACSRCEVGIGDPCFGIGALVTFVSGQGYHQERWDAALALLR